MKKAQRLRELIERPEILVLVGGGDAMTAKLVEAAGLEAAYMSGFATAAHLAAMPDAGLTTETELVMNAGYMASAVGIPLLCDGEAGFGNALNVRRTVQAFLQAGVAGVHIEDQLTPKKCAGLSGRKLLPVDEAVGKIRAALDARNEVDADFVVVARTDARGAVGGGLDDVIRRGKAYVAAGADAFMVMGLRSRDEVRAVRAEVKGPLFCLPPGDPTTSIEEQQELGLAVAFYALLGACPAWMAQWDLLRDIKARGTLAIQQFLARASGHPVGTTAGIFELLGMADVYSWEERYCPKDQLAGYETSAGWRPSQERGNRHE